LFLFLVRACKPVSTCRAPYLWVDGLASKGRRIKHVILCGFCCNAVHKVAKFLKDVENQLLMVKTGL